jgi:hypothetical protein
MAAARSCRAEFARFRLPRAHSNVGPATTTSDNMNLKLQFVTLGLPILLASCAAYGPYHPNTSAEPLNSVRGPKDGRYKLAFVEFGDQGYRKRPGALLDRACSEGDYLGSHGHMERQFYCHVRCSLSSALPADLRRQGGSLRAGSRSEGTGCATIKSRQVALT